MASTLKHDTWLWSKDAPDGRLFAAGVEHPGKGWSDEPPIPPTLAEENAALKAKLDEQAAAIAKFDPDGDGKPGGRARKAT